MKINNIQQSLLYVFEIQALKLKTEHLNNKKTERNREPILVYGTGDFCKGKVDKINISKYEIVVFVNPNTEKQGKNFEV